MKNKAACTGEQIKTERFPGIQRLWAWRSILLYALALTVLVSVFCTISPRREEALLRFVLFPSAIFAFALILYNCEFAKYREVRLMGAVTAWMFLSAALVDWQADGLLGSTWACAACVAFLLCFSAPYAFSAEELRKVLRIVCTAAIVGTVVLCSAALTVVALGKSIVSTGGNEIFGMGVEGRLHLFCNPNTTGPLAAMPMLLAVILLAASKKWLSRVALLAAMLLFYITLALSDSRTAIYGCAAVMGGCAFLYLNTKLPQRMRAWLRVLASAAAGLVVIVLLVCGTGLVTRAYNAYMTKSTATAATPSDTETPADATLPQETEVAEAGDDTSVTLAVTRGATNVGTLNGRTAIWKSAFQCLSDHPEILLYGVGALEAGQSISAYVPDGLPKTNLHNSFFSALFSFGLPGLLLILAFCVLLAIAAAKLAFQRLTDRTSLEMRLVPAILAYCVFEALLEEFLFTAWTLNHIWLWFSLAGGMVFCFLRVSQVQKAPQVATSEAAMYNDK